MNILCNISLIVGAASEFASDSKNNCTKNSPSIPYGRLCVCVYVCFSTSTQRKCVRNTPNFNKWLSMEDVLEQHVQKLFRIYINGMFHVWKSV